MLKNNTTTFIAHIAGWILFLSLVIAFVSNNSSIAESVYTSYFLLFCLIYLTIFYANTWILIPEFYLKKKYLIYSLFVAALLIGVIYVKPFDQLMRHLQPAANSNDFGPPRKMGEFGPPPPPINGNMKPPSLNQGRKPGSRTDIAGIILFVGVWSLSTAICIIRQWRLSERRLIQSEADKANAELSFLKAQVSPHFLFNTLNNIYSLAISKNDNTAASIMKLSNIMRYMTDEVRQEFVPLESEIECVQDYIDLQKLRLTKTTDVRFTVNGNPLGKTIAPLILMAFIENAFKYGVSNHETSAISINIVITDQQLIFESDNKRFSRESDLERVGIGLENTRRRLARIYPDKHKLQIDEEDQRFHVHLQIDN